MTYGKRVPESRGASFIREMGENLAEALSRGGRVVTRETKITEEVRHDHRITEENRND